MSKYDDIEVERFPIAKSWLMFEKAMSSDEDIYALQSRIRRADFEDNAELGDEEKLRVCLALANKWVFNGSESGIKEKWIFDESMKESDIENCKNYIDKEYPNKEKLFEKIVCACAEAYYYFDAYFRNEEASQPCDSDLEYYAYRMFPFFKAIGVNIGDIVDELDEDGKTVTYTEFKFKKEFDDFQKKYAERCNNHEADSIFVLKARERAKGEYVLYHDDTLVKCDIMAQGEIKVAEGTTVICSKAFEDCEGITNIELCKDLIAVKNMAFANCYGLQKMIFPNSVVKIGDGALLSCGNLLGVIFPENASLGESVCSGCSKLRKVILPKTLRFLGDRAFYGAGLSEIELPDYISSIGESAFANCSNLKHIKTPRYLMKVGNNAFEDCSSLEEIKFGLVFAEIGDEAFKNCTSLRRINLGNVDTIGKNLLAGVNTVKDIYFESSEDSWEFVSFGENWDNHNSYTFHCINTDEDAENFY